MNAPPHVGFALELVQADALARHRRLRGDDVRLVTGTDDNSLKNVLAAEAEGIATAVLVEHNAGHFRDQLDALQVAADDFIRTSTDPRHRPGVSRLWRACEVAGDLYRDSYEGLYCVGCEQFYDPEQLDDGRCPEHETVPERIAEENWFFRLSRYQDQLKELIESGRLRIVPEFRAREVLSFIGSGLRDFSVSRSQDRARGWGIPVPGDPEQVIYVWWDALGNYINAVDYANAGEVAGGRRARACDRQRRAALSCRVLAGNAAVSWRAATDYHPRARIPDRRWQEAEQVARQRHTAGGPGRSVRP